MASADLRDELTCSICLNIYTDPVTLTCGHNFCRTCIEDAIEASHSTRHKCPECRAEYKGRPALEKNKKLRNIAETFRSSHPEQEDVWIPCTYCDSPVPAVKTCLLCDSSLCEKHLMKHSKSAKHILMEPTAYLENRKCPIHEKVLEYYCLEDSTCVCVSCCLIGEHRGHKMESLHEASEKKKAKMQKILRRLISEKTEKENKIQSLQDENRELEDSIAGITREATALFIGIKEQLETLEKEVLSQIIKYGDKSSEVKLHQINQLEIKKAELSRKVGHIEELCNKTDPLAVLQSDGADETKSDEDGKRPVEKMANDEGSDEDDDDDDGDGESYEYYDEDNEDDSDESDDGDIEDDYDEDGKDDSDESDDGDIEDDYDEDGKDDSDENDDGDIEDDYDDDGKDDSDESDDGENEDDVEASSHEMSSVAGEFGLIFATLHTGLEKVVTWAKRECNAEETSDKFLNIDMIANILLDVKTAGNNTAVSGDGKAITFSKVHQRRPHGPKQFKIPQVLSTVCFSSGIHFWEVEGSPSGGWRVGVAYPSIDRQGFHAVLGENNKSWALAMTVNNEYIAIHDDLSVNLPVAPSCYRLGIFLDYESGHLSFYELGDPIQHLHTFTSSFKEPLHSAIFADDDHGWVRIRK